VFAGKLKAFAAIEDHTEIPVQTVLKTNIM